MNRSTLLQSRAARRQSRLGRARQLALLGWFAVCVLPVNALAQAAEGSGVRYSERVDATQFAAADPTARAPEVSASLMVTLAYAFIWLLAVALLVVLWRRSRALTEEMASATARLDRLDEEISRRAGSGT